MKDVFTSIPIAIRLILKDPINLMLSLFPTATALFLYGLMIATVIRNFDQFVSIFSDYISSGNQADFFAKILTTVLIIFVFFIMNWTFVVVVGIIAAPFNSMLSSRIEKKLVEHMARNDTRETFQQIGQGLWQTFKNELKKLMLIIFVASLAFILNFFPLMYPFGVFLVALVMAVQFIDYSWSRHNIHFGSCLADVMKNIIPYGVGGFIFLMLVTVPIINALIPAFASSYFTVLWLYRQKKIQ
jgi:CysZ protein